MKWERRISLSLNNDKRIEKERWTLYDSQYGRVISFNLDIKIGKPINLLSLKENIINNFEKKVSEIKESRNKLFQKQNTEKVLKCPICGISSENSEFKLEIYSAKYHQCKNCSHVFVIKRPLKQDLEIFYSKNKSYQATYSDKKTAELRVKEIAEPKLSWVIEQFKKLYGRSPTSILDVGAGSGHFVYACKKRGISAEGIELSEFGIDFAKQIYKVDLKQLDFITRWSKFKDFDIITFWGVIEHVPNPSELISSAAKAFNKKESMLVVEVPRWDCFGTKIQEIFPESIIRHLDPLGHINIFSDNSLATILYQNKFAPFAVWYIGMDSYELFIQLSNLIKDQPKLEIIRKNIPQFQKAFDKNRFCDEIIIAAKPSQGESKI